MIYLDKQEWGVKYNQLHSEVETEFFKFEVLPEYNDYGITDWNSIRGDDLRDIVVKSQAAINNLQDQVNFSLNRGVNLVRLRYLTFPLPKYILRQFNVYKKYIELGVKINILEGEDNIKDIDKNLFRDFLIFDKKHLLLIDNPNGCYNGGFYSNAEDEIKPFYEVKNLVENRAISFEHFLYSFNMDFPILL